MTEIEQFIEDAIEGGWHPTYRTLPHLSKFRSDKEVLLEPNAWIAVGKTREWIEYRTALGRKYLKSGSWIDKMHRFIGHLADGKTIEEALLAIK